MQHPRTRRSPGLAAAGALALVVSGAVAGVTAAAEAAPAKDAGSDAVRTTGQDAERVLVRLTGAPLATSGTVDRRANQKVDLAGARTRSVAAQLAAGRKQFRDWLRANAPRARVTGEFDFALNGLAVKLNGTSIDTLRGAPGVAEVAYEGVYVPTAHDDPDLALIDAPEGWAAAGAASSDAAPSTWAGHGVQVGVIDSGIDVDHPCFDDSGFPRTRQLGDPAYTNNKVVVARVFNNKLNQSGFDAAAVEEHGTHVAGTIACDLHTPAVVEGADIPYDPSGVAPGAQLGNYNVFPGTVEDARSEDILNAMEAAARDGMDVLNLSLGGGSHGKQDLLTGAADNLDRAGIVVAISAGNDGPGAGTIGSPGMAERALTAGASSVGHYVGLPVTSGSTRVVTATGDFPVPDAPLTAPLAVVTDASGALSEACAGLPAGSLTGTIALVSRGTCTFDTKVSNAKAAGAVAVIVVNNVAGDPSAMASSLAAGDTLPAVMAALDDRAALVAWDGRSVTIGTEPTYVQSGNDDLLAAFSSHGPVDVSYRVKPDVVAPGANVLSSVPLGQCQDEAWYDPAAGCWAFLSGTSMASPHLAGMAAVVRDAHPGWSAGDVRSAIVNTADQDGVLKTDGTGPETDVQSVGAGMADLDAAVDARVALSQPSVSFGAVPNGSGQARQVTVTVTSLTGQPLTLPVRVEDSTGPGTFAVAPRSVSVPASGSASVTVTFSAPKAAAAGSTQAFLELGPDGSDVAHAALFAYLR